MNTLPDTSRATDLIRSSLGILSAECPQAYALLCQQLSGKTVEIWIEDEGLRLHFTKDQSTVMEVIPGQPERLRLLTGWQTLLDLADAHLTIYTAIMSGQMALFGTAAELALLYNALQTYLRGAIRTLSFPALLDEVRRQHSRQPA